MDDAGRTGAFSKLGTSFAGSLGDPRLFQIFALGILLASGAWLRDFSLRPAQILLTFSAALATQRLTWRFYPPAARSYRSAIITAFSLTLLLRADNLFVHPLAAAAAISSKSFIRIRGKHLFNPAMLGIVAALLLLPGSWISPGQWGNDVALAGWFVALGALVTRRASRGDISWSFLAFYLGAIALRVAWLGQRFAVLAHQLSSGALLLFAFFMISDPMTAPNRRGGRIAHAAVVAALAYAWQFGLYRTNGLIWALFAASFAVPVWDLAMPAPKFEWNPQGAGNGQVVTHTNQPVDARARDARDRIRSAA
jgi:enediyne biosynthesis protein E5